MKLLWQNKFDGFDLVRTSPLYYIGMVEREKDTLNCWFFDRSVGDASGVRGDDGLDVVRRHSRRRGIRVELWYFWDMLPYYPSHRRKEACRLNLHASFCVIVHRLGKV